MHTHTRTHKEILHMKDLQVSVPLGVFRYYEIAACNSGKGEVYNSIIFGFHVVQLFTTLTKRLIATAQPILYFMVTRCKGGSAGSVTQQDVPMVN